MFKVQNVQTILYYNIIIIFLGLGIWEFIFDGAHDVILTLITVLISLITFFGFLSLENSHTSLDAGDLQTSITVSIVTTYFWILSMTIFLHKGQTQTELQEQLVTSFTTILSVVIAFYFSSSAYQRGKKIEAKIINK